MSGYSMEADLATWGKVIRLETTGRRSGQRRIVTIGFVAADAGALLVAASSPSTGWAANLDADPACVVELDGERRPFSATRLGPHERAVVVRDLILKYGTPAERLGAGPAFRLEPAP
jgi:deazaflavin-dependent oxidoreductase (nitroreductase family)